MVESLVLGHTPTLTRADVAGSAGVPMEVAEDLWHHLGFPHAGDDEIAFTEADVEALRMTQELVRLGVLSEDRQAALVRTWGRSYARLAEWQTSLLAEVARERGGDEVEDLVALSAQVLPLVESLQDYVWRRHLVSAARRMLTVADATAVPLAVGFLDIVGYTARSKRLSDKELVDWVEEFEDTCSDVVVEHGGRVIKYLGDGVFFTFEDVEPAARTALELAALGEDKESAFPHVRAGISYGDVVLRLGDVFGPTVNIAARLTTLARPSSVVVDENAAAALEDVDGFQVEKMRRTSVKGYSRLQAFRLRSRSE
ncbi:adenylate/guanylate cyclase domain-containing protein [Nocardioides sp. KC13]|uniref:Adenylate/guanylate cyclase domain-containing protein n=1 Tax=Nocardioides turkmenicus TaxID=2711220 RepID=A0A6M1QYA9_9ACTN|nr:adenylate/guanylate cyclase domain-containing protein [Nocardioides sp. KC13]